MDRRALASLALVTLLGCATATPPFRDAGGKVLRGSIAEETYLQMPGAKEYLLLRGRDASNPLLLFVHGGPGGSETALMRLFNADLENHFVVAYWDQRGAGKSYAADIPRDTMSIAQFVDDMNRVVDYLRARLGPRRVLVLGHSWGSALGMLYIHEHPERVAGYIGVGQVADNRADELHAYEFAVEQARERENQKAIEDLARIGPPPYRFQQLVVRDRWLEHFGGVFHVQIDKWAVAWRALWTPEAGLCDLWRLWHGIQFSQEALWSEFARLDLTEEVPSVQVPVTFILGRFDQRTWAPLAARYLEELQAPQKHLIWLERSAHNGPFEEPQAFRRAVIAAGAADRRLE